MKTISIQASLLALVFATAIGCSPESKEAADTFTVSGTVEGLDTDYMSYGYRNEEGKRVSDSVLVKNDQFTYTGKIKEATHIIFWPNVERTIKRSGRGYYPVA